MSRRVDLRLAVPAAVVWIGTALVIGMRDAGPVLVGLVAGAAVAAGAAGVVGARGIARRASPPTGNGEVGRSAPGLAERRRPTAEFARSLLVMAAVSLALAALAATSVVTHERSRTPAVLTEAARSGRAATLLVEQSATPVEGRMEARIREVTVGDKRMRVDAPALLFAARSGSGAGPFGTGSSATGSTRAGAAGAAPAATGSSASGSNRAGSTATGSTAIGSTLRLSGVLRAADPGDDVAYLVFARGAIDEVRGPPPLLAGAERLRDGLVRASTSLPGDGGRLLPGLAVGDTSAVDPGLAQAMKGASLTHLTAVSGANCAVVVALAALLVGALGGSRGARVAAGLVTLAAFVVLVTPQPSVLRAATMSALVLLAVALGRPVQGVPLLALAVIVLLVVDPWLARDYGFVLSVLATGGLLLLAPPLARRLARHLPRWLAVALAVPIAAQLACQPVLILLSPTVPLYGVPANLLAETAAPIATVVGLVACLAAALSPPLGVAIAAVAWVPAAWIAAVARTASALPAAQLPWPPGLVGVVAMTALTAAALVVVLSRSKRMRAAAGGTLAVALVIWAGGAAGSAIATAVGRPGDWQYAMCDVGQGDASVIRSAGRIAVIDTGPEPARMTACLERLGIARIDLLVLTHYDLDHVGGTAAVVGRVHRALLGPSSGPDDDRVAERLRQGGAEVESVTRGLVGRLGDLDWRVVWPPPRGVESGNAASVTLSVTPHPGCAVGCLSGLFLGDLGEESQSRLRGSMARARYDVVKVAHHGSADQQPALYDDIRATVGLIGVGADNDYGHPTASALRILADAGTRPYRTDRQGMLLVADRGHGRVAVWTERSPPGDG